MRRCVLLLVALLWASASHALTIPYTDSASFLGALPGPATTLDFESVAAGTLLPSGSSLDGITFTYSIPPETLQVINAFDTTSGSNSLGLTGGDNALQEGDVVSFGLATPVNAFGLFVITSDPALAGEIQLATSVGTVSGSGTAETVLADGGIVYFLGLTSDTPFSSATLQFNSGGQVYFLYNIDDITTAVPEPGTCGLLLLAASLGVAVRRRRPC